MYKEFYAQAYLTIMLYFISPGMQELLQLMTRLYLNEIFSIKYDKFANEMENVDWEFIKNIDDAQTTYSSFHNLLIEKYNSSFPLKILKKAYYTKSLGLQRHFGNLSKLKTSCMLTDIRAIILMEDVLRTKNIATNYIIYYVLLNVSVTRTCFTNISQMWRSRGKFLNDNQ